MSEPGNTRIERLARRIRRVPFLGPVARRVGYAPRDIRSAWHDFQRKRAFTVSAITRRNSREGYETLYRSPSLLAEYLQDDRLRFFGEVADICVQSPFHSVLDAGCGTGHMLKALVDRLGEQLTVAGFDYVESGVERARTLLPQADIRLGDIHQPPFDERFDLVICTEVLEHVDAPERALRALSTCCTPDGRLIITVPDGRFDEWEGHANFWSPTEFETFLGAAGTASVQIIDEGRTLLAVVYPRGHQS